VLDATRRAGATVIHVTVSFRDDYADAPPHVPLF
jgi:nicotinamidase-related amidase